MKKPQKSFHASWRHWGLLVLRITLGGIFLYHGMVKLTDMTQTITSFASLGFSPFWAWITAIAQALGGLFVLIGYFTRQASFVLAIVMVVAAYSVSGNGWKSMELPVVLFGLALGLSLIGCGRYSLCSFRHRRQCKGGVCQEGCSCSCHQ